MQPPRQPLSAIQVFLIVIAALLVFPVICFAGCAILTLPLGKSARDAAKKNAAQSDKRREDLAREIQERNAQDALMANYSDQVEISVDALRWDANKPNTVWASYRVLNKSVVPISWVWGKVQFYKPGSSVPFDTWEDLYYCATDDVDKVAIPPGEWSPFGRIRQEPYVLLGCGPNDGITARMTATKALTYIPQPGHGH